MQRARRGDFARGRNEIPDRTNLQPGLWMPAAAEAQIAVGSATLARSYGVLANTCPATRRERLWCPACRASEGYVETSQLLGTGSKQGLP